MIFARKERTSLESPEARLDAQVGQALKLVLKAVTAASDNERSVIVGADMFDFVLATENRVGSGAALRTVLTDEQRQLFEQGARAIFRRADPTVQSVRKQGAETALAILTDTYAQACEAEIPGLAASGVDRALDDGIVTHLAALMARQAHGLPRSVKKNPEAFEQLGVLVFVSVWMLSEWLKSPERSSARVSLGDVNAWTDFVGSYEPFPSVPITDMDLLEGLPTPTWVEEHPQERPLTWLETVTNGYLAFQAGEFGHCFVIYMLAREERELPPPRLAEFEYAQTQVAGAPPSASGEALSVSSQERLAFLSEGLTFDPDLWERHLDAPQDAKERAQQLVGVLDSDQASVALDELVELSGMGMLPPEIRARMAVHLSRLGRKEEALHQLRYLITIPPDRNEMARDYALGWLAFELFTDKRYSEALAAARQALRGNFSNVTALLALSKLETTVNCDFPMATLLELRAMAIDELRGRSAAARSARDRLRDKPPGNWAYGFAYSPSAEA